MPEWLSIVGGVAGILGTFLAIYVIVDNKVGAKKKLLDDMKNKIIEQDIRIVQTEKVTRVVEEFMEDLLLEQLRNRPPNNLPRRK